MSVWTGVNDIARGFNQLDLGVRQQVLLDAIEPAAEVYREGMELRAPRRTGRLAMNMVLEIRQKIGEGVVAYIGPAKPVFYGEFVEFGTRFMAAQPFMRPTLTNDSDQALRAFGAKAHDSFERLRLT